MSEQPPYGPPYDSYPQADELPPAAHLPLAPIWRRAVARLIDTGLLGTFGFALVYPITLAIVGVEQTAAGTRESGGGWSAFTLFVVLIIVAGAPFLYEAVQLALWGRTVGKRVLGLRVVTADPAGAHLPVTTAVTRAAINNVVYLLGCGVGTLMAYLWAIWDEPLHQALHDRLVGTVVIDDRVVYEE